MKDTLFRKKFQDSRYSSFTEGRSVEVWGVGLECSAGREDERILCRITFHSGIAGSILWYFP